MATCKEIESSSDQILQLCNLCESNVSDGFCDECEEFMCQSCFDIHSRVRTCRHHVFLDNASDKHTKKNNSEPCNRHPHLHLEYYCIVHKLVGCVKCFFPEHRNCHYQNIEDAAKEFKDSGEDTRLKREIQRLENMHSQYSEQYEQDQEKATEINDTAVYAAKSFKDTVTSFVAKVEELALQTAEQLRLQNEALLEKRLSELSKVGEEIEICTVKFENQDNADKLFIEALEIKPKVEQLERRIKTLGPETNVSKYEFQPNKLLMEMIQKGRSFGEVCILPEEPQSNQTRARNNYGDVSTIGDVQSDHARRSVEPHPIQNKKPIDTMHVDISEDERFETCVICMDTVTDPKTINCGHTFCTECIDQQFQYQKRCPTCGKICGVITGDQPDGTMNDGVYDYKRLPGYEDYGTIYIMYNFHGGKQKACHPSPGKPYKGIQRTAYLPNNNEGRKILKMLRVAFDRKVVFIIGNSRTTGQEGVLTWNGIHHKTDHRPNTQFGYPDPTYLARVKEELEAKGVTEDDI